MNGDPIGRVVTRGVFELDRGSWEVDDNIGVLGDDSQVVVFDAAHDAAPIIAAVGARHVVAVCTHGHNDHVAVAPEFGEELDAPVLLHPADDMLWRNYAPGQGLPNRQRWRHHTRRRPRTARHTNPRGMLRAQYAGTRPNWVRYFRVTRCSTAAPPRRAPLPHFARTALHDTEVEGIPIPAGSKVLLNYVPANRDPRRFEDPERFDFHRRHNAHVAFGHGIHLCIARHLARAELTDAASRLSHRLPDIEIAGKVRFAGLIGGNIMQIAELPVRFTPETSPQ